MDADALASRYFDDIANERDAGRRAAAIAGLVAEHVRYADDDGPVEGREAFTARIADLAAMMPPAARFSLTRPAQAVDDAVVLHWSLATPGSPPAVTGTDVAIVADDRIVRLYAVTD